MIQIKEANNLIHAGADVVTDILRLSGLMVNIAKVTERWYISSVLEGLLTIQVIIFDCFYRGSWPSLECICPLLIFAILFKYN